MGQARRVLPQVKEGDDDFKPRTDELSLPIMPDLDSSHTLGKSEGEFTGILILKMKKKSGSSHVI